VDELPKRRNDLLWIIYHKVEVVYSTADDLLKGRGGLLLIFYHRVEIVYCE
jgi:hypothetical protein